MNNEEAIEILQNISKVYRQFTEKEIEALNMAIKALQENEKLKAEKVMLLNFSTMLQ